MRGRIAGLGAAAAAVTAVTTFICMSAGSASALAVRPAVAVRAHVAAAPAAAAAAASAAAYTPPKRDLSEGMRGADVKALQQRLAALKYYPGKADGQFGGNTLAAVWAFQEINGISPTGTVGPVTKRALVHPRTYHSPYYRGKRSTRVEVSQALEVLVLFKDSKIQLISHVSSGGGYFYDGGAAQAVTPNGTYDTTVYMPGWVKVPLGEMFNPVFFIGTAFAIHGDTYVPVGPASHGCVRVPMYIAQFFHTLVKTPGTQVHVYGKAQWMK